MRPSADHSLLSPSGRTSKRARAQALERERVRLFGPDGLPWPQCPQPSRADRLRQQAAELRKLAEGGMYPRKYRRKAAELEAEADRQTATGPG